MRSFVAGHIKKVIDASALLGVNRINTFIGRDKDKPVEENFEMFRQVWTDIISYTEQRKVKVGIENCPMIFTRDNGPAVATLRQHLRYGGECSTK